MSLVTSGDRPLRAVVFLVFIIAAWYTVTLAGRMGGAVRMPDGQTMGTIWMHMPGDSWIGPGAAFATMWGVMMLAMMLPSAWPSISSFRQVAHARGEPWAGALSLVMMSAYFLVWLAFGLLAYGAGLTLNSAAMLSPVVGRALPIAAAGGLVIAGLYQLTPFKRACLQKCQSPLYS